MTVINNATLILKDKQGNEGVVKTLTDNDINKIANAITDVGQVVDPATHMPIEATKTSTGVVQLATAQDITNGTAGKVVDAQELNNFAQTLPAANGVTDVSSGDNSNQIVVSKFGGNKTLTIDNVEHADTATSANSVAWGNVQDKPSSFNPSSHTHDDRYYTESEIDAKLLASLPTYRRSSDWLGDKLTITTPDTVCVVVNGKLYMNTVGSTIDISDADSWDNSTYATAANRAGKDFYIYALENSGTTPTYILSANSTVPTGYTADNSRKIGGFHCLCLSVGNISGHPASGYVTGDIIPNSVWDLKFRATTDTNDGLVYVKGLNKWVAIYLPSWDGSKLVSVYRGAIVDGGSSFSLDGEQFVEYIGEAGGELPSRDEFKVFAFGSNQLTNINGSADPGTTGGHTDTAGRRMISNYFIEDCCGVLWQWSKDCYEAMSTSWSSGNNWMNDYSWQTQSVVSTIGPSNHKNLGSCLGLLRRALLGGIWGGGSGCGSRCVDCDCFGSHVASNFSGRLVSGALNLP